ncbi:MAG: hypothetical protein ACRD8Z_26705 [Nitrososphaeraceae archaeon]
MDPNRELERLEKKLSLPITEKWDYSENQLQIPEALEKELEEEGKLMDHLSEKHVYPILKWKLSVGLEKMREDHVGIFVNYGEDFQNLTIEEWEYCRLEKKLDQIIGYDPKNDSNYKF